MFILQMTFTTFVAQPLVFAFAKDATMIATDVTAPFFALSSLLFLCALFAHFHGYLHQIWGFIAPGLYQHEKKMLMPILASSYSIILWRYSLLLFCSTTNYFRLFYKYRSRNDDSCARYKLAI